MANETAQRFLESLEIASPCHVDWDEMTGDERARFCMHCEKNVYNITEMSRMEAEQLIKAQEGPICIRMYKRHDGTVINDNCPVGLRAVRQKMREAKAALWKIAAATVALISTMFTISPSQAQNQSTNKEPKDKVSTQNKQKAKPQTPICNPGAKKVSSPGVPTMGMVAPPQPTAEQLRDEESVKLEAIKIIAKKLKGKSPTEGTVSFHIEYSTGEIASCEMTQSSGDKELDESIISALEGNKVTKPSADGRPTWRTIIIRLSDMHTKSKPKDAK